MGVREGAEEGRTEAHLARGPSCADRRTRSPQESYRQEGMNPIDKKAKILSAKARILSGFPR